MTKGRFVTLEGGEGTGKTTQLRLLGEWLRSTGREVVLTREPGGSPQGEALRSLLVSGEAGRWDPISETLLHYAARREHLRLTIVPALTRGAWVVCDRFADSTMAYQHYGLRVAADLVDTLYGRVVGAHRPDLTLVLDLDPEIAFARIAARRADGTRYEDMDHAFHMRVREGFRLIARDDPDRCVLIDAAPGAQAVQSRLRTLISERFGLVDGG